jgi:nicotinamidase-related amidase
MRIAEGNRVRAVPRVALLVMDVQEDIVERYAADGLVEKLRRAISVAREHGVIVVFVRLALRPGHPEVSPANAMFAKLASSRASSSYGSPVHTAIAPQDGDIEVIKKRVSAFAGSDLELVLRAQGVDTLVLTGIASSGVVLSTLRQAADLDYRLVVLSDCCLDADEEVQRVLMTKVFPRQATVITMAEWEDRLGGV